MEGFAEFVELRMSRDGEVDVLGRKGDFRRIFGHDFGLEAVEALGEVVELRFEEVGIENGSGFGCRFGEFSDFAFDSKEGPDRKPDEEEHHHCCRYNDRATGEWGLRHLLFGGVVIVGRSAAAIFFARHEGGFYEQIAKGARRELIFGIFVFVMRRYSFSPWHGFWSVFRVELILR